jgi:hypothetical protein
MLQTMIAWAAAHVDFCAVVLFTAVAVAACCFAFPQAGSGGDFDFGSDWS